MQRVVLVVASCSLLLGACGRDIAAEPLAAFDLTQPAVVESVLAELPPESRGAFATFTIHHLASSTAFCGDVLVNEAGREPATIGEAIRLTIAREADLRRDEQAVDLAALSPAERREYRLAQLLEAHEHLVDRRENAIMLNGDAVRQEEAFRHLEQEIARSRADIAAMRAATPAATGST
ncbi:hypothetical protein [Porphyrobacter sp. GA68]|uniref:hypothetical protein n=1 Tax=Porphyrobacter sp. GA68 TaxID=2883480 RepID=UPI001D17DFB7|nr:hypothetical protein [Porphyrobacter sp. GA68]